MNVAKGVGFGALKGSLAGGGLGAIVDMGRGAGKKEEQQKLLEMRAEGKLAAAPSKEKKQALTRVGSFFSQEDPAKKWDSFTDQAARKSFVKALANDPRADEKLKLHADRMNRLINGKPIEVVQGRTGKYSITRLRGGEVGCTCSDWRYKKSVAPVGQTDCKHITEWKTRRVTEQAAK